MTSQGDTFQNCLFLHEVKRESKVKESRLDALEIKFLKKKLIKKEIQVQVVIVADCTVEEEDRTGPAV